MFPSRIATESKNSSLQLTAGFASHLIRHEMLPMPNDGLGSTPG